jgi:hypothetical protein
MVVLSHADLGLSAPADLGLRAPVAHRWSSLEAPLTARIAYGLAVALAAVLIPGFAARWDCSPTRPRTAPPS